MDTLKIANGWINAAIMEAVNLAIDQVQVAKEQGDERSAQILLGAFQANVNDLEKHVEIGIA